MLTLRQFISEAYPGHPILPSLPDTPVAGIECDSRKIEKDFVFVAVRGAKKNGADFIPEALKKGAVAVVTEDQADECGLIPMIRIPDSREAAARLASIFFGHPSRHMKIIGITGTNGKTTSAYLMEHFLKKENKRTGILGTVSHRFGQKEIPAAETTPGPVQLQAIFSQMRQAACEFAVMEVSSHALDQNRVGSIDFEAALFTNLTQDHLDYHGTLEAYFEAKSRLFLSLGPDKTAILNADDARVLSLKNRLRCRVVTYGIRQPADWKAVPLGFGIDAAKFRILFQGRKINVQSPLIGFHNVYNVLGSLAACAALGLEPERLAGHLGDFEGVPGRLEPLRCGQEFAVFIDFAHTPDGLENVLKALLPCRKRKLFVLFGCGGDRDRSKRPRMAEVAGRYADAVFLTSDNPRSENPRSIVEEIREGFPENFTNFVVTLDRRQAIRQALLAARKDDIVLLAGKGHERTQITGDQVLPFSDREEAERVLRGH